MASTPPPMRCPRPAPTASTRSPPTGCRSRPKNAIAPRRYSAASPLVSVGQPMSGRPATPSVRSAPAEAPRLDDLRCCAEFFV
jgi:hypothetical protein